MSTFQYIAMDKAGKEIRGKVEASSEGMVVERLRSLGYFPTEVKKQASSPAGEIKLEDLPGIHQLYRLMTGGGIKLKTLTTFTRQLATLIGAGLPLLRSLEIAIEQVDSSNMNRALKQVAGEVESGTTFSEALSHQPQVFNKLYVNMVRAGEIGGALEEILDRLATYYEKSASTRSKVHSALYYPVAVLLIAGFLVTGILLFIVPRFQEIYEGLGARLPSVTMVLVHGSHGIRYQAPYVLGGLGFIILVYRQLNKTNTGKYVFDVIKLKLPLFGVLNQKAAVARFARTFSTLLDAGVPILQALVIVRDTAGNEVIAQATVKIHSSVREGDSLSEPMRQCPVFPSLAPHMIAVGEETGATGKMLAKVAEAYEREVDSAVDGLTALIEPLLIVFLGGLIGFIVIALYYPIINLYSVVNQN
jgi:type IV pilus assembly protein PilC